MTFPERNNPFWQFEIAPQIGSSPKLNVQTDDFQLVVTSDEPGARLYAYGDARTEAARVAWNEQIAQVRALSCQFAVVMIDQRLQAQLDPQNAEYLGPHWGHRWEFYWALEPLTPVPNMDCVTQLVKDTPQWHELLGDVRYVLETAIPITSGLREIAEHDWFVYRDMELAGHDGVPESGVCAVMGGKPHGKQIHFSGLGALPATRGRGAGSAVMVRAIETYLEQGVPGVFFGMWGWNHKARRLYSRLGINHGPAMIFGGREPFVELGE